MKLYIDKIVHRGLGLGRVDGKVWMVPFTAPGDLVSIEVVKESRSMGEGRVIDVIEPGPDRIEPQCPHFGDCGGCALQHLAYPAQVRAKAGVLAENINRIGKLYSAPEPTTITGTPWQWRSRIELNARYGNVGFFRQGSHDIVPIQTCPIARPELLTRIDPLRSAIAKAGIDHGTFELVTGADGAVFLVAKPGPDVPRNIGKLFTKVTDGVFVSLRDGPNRRWVVEGRETGVIETVGPGRQPVALPFDPRGFTQGHLELNRVLATTVLDSCGANLDGANVLELFSGGGNLTVPLAGAGANVTAVEVNPGAEALAKRAFAVLGLAANFVAQDVAVFLENYRRGKRTPNPPDIIVADPPRTGLGPLAGPLAKLNASRIVLVACDPAALARDSAVLAGHGYNLNSLVLLDLFPQTWHMETVATFER